MVGQYLGRWITRQQTTGLDNPDGSNSFFSVWTGKTKFTFKKFLRDGSRLPAAHHPFAASVMWRFVEGMMEEERIDSTQRNILTSLFISNCCVKSESNYNKNKTSGPSHNVYYGKYLAHLAREITRDFSDH